jgi:hypothetical protein
MRSEVEGELAALADVNDRQHCGRAYTRQAFKLHVETVEPILRTAAN